MKTIAFLHFHDKYKYQQETNYYYLNYYLLLN